MGKLAKRQHTGEETPDTVHGRLLEAVHLSGYTFERACGELEWLLDEDRWQRIGSGYTDINAFLATMDFSEFRVAIDQRKHLAKRLHELDASQRATARMLGVDHKTIHGDLTSGEGSPPATGKSAPDKDPSAGGGENSPPWFQTADPAKLAKGRAARKDRDQEAEQRRVEEAQAQIAIVEPMQVDIRHGDFRQVLGDLTGIDAIITDPPYGRKALSLLSDLAAWANRVLSPDGVLAVLIGQSHLPEVYRRLSTGPPYRWTACYLTDGPAYVSQSASVHCGWKPVLLYGGGPRLSDVIRSEGADTAAKEHHKWGQDFAAFATLIERLTRPGQRVADPFCGGGTTLLAARVLGRHGIGADIDASAVQKTKERLGHLA